MSDEKIVNIEKGFLLRYLKSYPQMKLWFKKTREDVFKENHKSNYGGDCSEWPIPPLDLPSAKLLKKELSHASRYSSGPQPLSNILKGKTTTGRWSGSGFSNIKNIPKEKGNIMEIAFVSLEKDFKREPTKFMERIGIDHYISGTLFETSEQAVLHQNNLEEDYRGGIIPVVVDDFMLSYKKRMSPHYPVETMNKEQLDEQERHEQDIIRENEEEKDEEENKEK